uniref:Uncharacterized protein n=1 Tax=Callorhinchus milii TaxID=7868 RepID=A0A4W3GBN5_CALMI
PPDIVILNVNVCSTHSDAASPTVIKTVFAVKPVMLLSLISRLGGNNLTSESTEDLVSDLSINHSLTELDMSNNQLRDYGVKRLSEALRNPECKIQRLRLGGNNLTAHCTENLASALSTNHSLSKLDLSNNKLRDYGVRQLCEALKKAECKIQKLENRKGCRAMASTLIKNPSLTELNLNNNKLRDCGVKRLCVALRNPECKIQSLGYVAHCVSRLNIVTGIGVTVSVCDCDCFYVRVFLCVFVSLCVCVCVCDCLCLCLCV